MSDSFLPSLWSLSNQSLLGSRESALLCNQVDFSTYLSDSLIGYRASSIPRFWWFDFLACRSSRTSDGGFTYANYQCYRLKNRVPLYKRQTASRRSVELKMFAIFTMRMRPCSFEPPLRPCGSHRARS